MAITSLLEAAGKAIAVVMIGGYEKLEFNPMPQA
jgi:hypothetical protein